MSSNTLKNIKALNAYLETVKANLDRLQKELAEAKRTSQKLEKARAIRAIVEELEALHPQIIKARAVIARVRGESERY